MLRSAILSALITPVFLFAMPVTAQEGDSEIDPSDVVGVWKTHGDKSLVKVGPCEDSICGTLEWFAELDSATAPILDSQNDDETLRTRELKGAAIIYGFKPTRKGWRKGRIYDPESGKTYKSKVTRIASDKLRVEGCIGPVCQKFVWLLAPDQNEVSHGDDAPVPAPASATISQGSFR